MTENDLLVTENKLPKNMTIRVPRDYKFTGAVVKRELTELFQYIWNFKDSIPKEEFAGEFIINKYPKAERIKELLGTW